MFSNLPINYFMHIQVILLHYCYPFRFKTKIDAEVIDRLEFSRYTTFLYGERKPC